LAAGAFALVASVSIFGSVPLAEAQPTSGSALAPRPEAVRDARPGWHALTGATVHVSPGQVIERATVLVKDGRIERVVSDGGAIGAGYRVWDYTGMRVYAGFIEPFYEIEVPSPDRSAPGVHSNPNVVPQRSALDGVGLDNDARKGMRAMGFGAVVLSPARGNIRGTAAMVSLGEVPAEASAVRPPVYRKDVYQTMSLRTGEFGFRVYPSSQMGAIALIRQTLMDAEWRAMEREKGGAGGGGGSEVVSALDALADKGVPLAFNVTHELESLRAAKIGREFARPTILIGSGHEYKRLDAIVADGNPTVLPLRFPKQPQVDSVAKIDELDLRDLMAWEQAPTNPRRLDERGMQVALTTSDLEARKDFPAALRRAIQHGLSEERALAMLTTNPAKMLGVESMLGTVEGGKVANLIVTDGPVFGAKTRVRDVWVDGTRYQVTEPSPKEIAGTWDYTFGDVGGAGGEDPHAGALIVEVGDDGKVSVKIEPPPAEATPAGDEGAGEGDGAGGGEGGGVKRAPTPKVRNVAFRNGILSYVMDLPETNPAQAVIATATISGERMLGQLVTPETGVTRSWRATRRAPSAVALTPAQKMSGTWRITEADGRAVPADDADAPRVEVSAKGGITIIVGEAKSVASDVVIEEGRVAFSYENEPFGSAGIIKDEATIAEAEGVMTMAGRSVMADGSIHTWKATRDASDGGKKDEEKRIETPDLPGYPFGPYALKEMPMQRNVAIVNATVWTSAEAGIIENGAVLFSGGKLVYVGPGASMPRFDDSYTVIDASGKHVTPGLIDCHSHTGLFRWGVNEFATNISSECAIGDTTDPDTINWYRQLAGGLVAANQLHGSANPIGGQSQTVKLRWGVRHPDEMHVEGAKPGIKFALGENVKQSNSGQGSSRYPQTRMGVDAIIRDRFQQAKEYASAWEAWERGGRQGVSPRKDLQLEALAEILAGERLVHCHSYRQDEILMLARVAQDFGFKIGTFQHVLEGYKVAEAIKETAIGASAFSDWWNFKVEVQDAIPYNGALMHFAGVNVSFNSDDDQLATHMNIEAAKAVRYGNVPPAEALKFVTINPAMQLMIDDRTGSLEVGKDADVVIWSRDPLTSTARAEATFVDGREMFSLEQDARFRAEIAAERTRLIQKILTLDVKPTTSASRGGEGEDASGTDGPRGRRPRPDQTSAGLDGFRTNAWEMGSTAGDCGLLQMGTLLESEAQGVGQSGGGRSGGNQWGGGR
jgi:N-acetylglucosamine-6-phosphate deacetylase